MQPQRHESRRAPKRNPPESHAGARHPVAASIGQQPNRARLNLASLLRAPQRYRIAKAFRRTRSRLSQLRIKIEIPWNKRNEGLPLIERHVAGSRPAGPTTPPFIYQRLTKTPTAVLTRETALTSRFWSILRTVLRTKADLGGNVKALALALLLLASALPIQAAPRTSAPGYTLVEPNARVRSRLKRRKWKKIWVASWVAFAVVNVLDAQASRGGQEANPPAPRR